MVLYTMKSKKVDEKYQTRDGLGKVYQDIAEGKCVCWGFRAACPQHGPKISIISTSITSSYFDVKEVT